jgi:hypothetical protein
VFNSLAVTLIEKVGTEVTIGFLACEHVLGSNQQRMTNRHKRTLLAAPGSNTPK